MRRRFETDIWNTEEFTGIILFSLLWEHYKDRNWRKKDISNKVCFFSGNNKDCEEFEKRLKQIDEQYRLDSDARKALKKGQANFFKKNKDDDFRKWVRGDRYLEILENIEITAPEETTIDMYMKIMENYKNLREIRTNLVTIRNLLAIILEKLCSMLNVTFDSRNIPNTIDMLYRKSDERVGIAESDIAKAIQRFGSKDGAHVRLLESLSDDNREFSKYIDLVEAMVSSLKYFILWYGELSEKCQKQGK